MWRSELSGSRRRSPRFFKPRFLTLPRREDGTTQGSKACVGRVWPVPSAPRTEAGEAGGGAFIGAESATGAPSSGRRHVLPRQGRHSRLPSSSSKEGPHGRDTASTWPWCSRTWGLGSTEPGVLTGCRDLWGAHPRTDGGKNDVSETTSGPAGSAGKDRAAQSGWRSEPVSTRQGASQQIPREGKVRKPLAAALRPRC